MNIYTSSTIEFLVDSAQPYSELSQPELVVPVSETHPPLEYLPQCSLHKRHTLLTPVQSQAIIAGPQVFVSGQIPADKTGALIEGSITDKTTQCCENIVAILKEANTPVEKVVKVNVFLDDMAHFAEMNGVFEKYFAHKPARSCVAVKTLPKNVPVEIECIAYNGMVSAKL
jgi:reactive intermediate/imine deaminase